MIIKYHTLKSLLFSNFLLAMFENQLSVIVLSGEPSQGQLQEQWEELHDEFLRRGGGMNYMHSMTVIKEISRLSSKITICECTVELMLLTYSDVLIAIIQNQGFKNTFPKEKVQYQKDIDYVKGRIAADSMRLMMKKDEFAQIVKDSETGKSMNSEMYQEMIWDMSLSFKMQFDMDKFFVNDFLITSKKYKEYIDSVTRNTKRYAK